ncbi:hypothetical protein N7510_005966 [Penicillium lagena]|uniref:uncharacterized protein n=1 Tax=Penicillium lagena TaxID=94218 RepID=UPI0025406EC5|nr:uncharacterized protein N7510_005966 [Penicillium lagena]KAJ5612772.1 hypothetical protein N7510_005966 [Penicillium lagena]
MTTPSKFSTCGNWSIVHNEQNEKDDKSAEDRRTLARTWSVPKSMCILSDTKTEMPSVPELLPSKLRLPHLGSETAERVFPIRSVVSFDSNPSSALHTPSLDKLESPISPFSDAFWTSTTDDQKGTAQTASSREKDTDHGPVASKRPDYLSRMHQKKTSLESTLSELAKGSTPGSPSFPQIGTLASPCGQHSVCNRSPGDIISLSTQLQQTIRKGGNILATHEHMNWVLHSREDDRAVTIQPSGTLLVVSGSGGNLNVQIVSSNSRDIMGYSTDELFKLESFCNIMFSSQKNTFLDHARFVLSDDYDVERLGAEVFCLSIITPEGGTRNLWCTMHTSKAFQDYVICELEPDVPVDREGNLETKDTQPMSESSDNVFSKTESLTTLPNLGDGEVVQSTELLNTLPRIFQRMASAQTLESLVHHIIFALQQLTKFHRVTMYHFDADRNGIVVAEAVDPSLNLASYEGIHFPESTFPDNMKKSYLRNTVCFSYCNATDPAELVFRTSTNKTALDMKHTYLSTASAPSKHLAGTPTYACLSINISVFGKLWGLISCQSYDASQKLHPLVQKTCWSIAEAVSSNIERLSYTLPFPMPDQTVVSSDSDLSHISAPSGDLLGLFGADYAAASIMAETKILGKPPDSQEVLVLIEYLRAKQLDTVLWSTDITVDFQDLSYSPGFHHLAGLLYIPLSADGTDFIIFFRANSAGGRHMSEHDRKTTVKVSEKSIEWSAAEFGKASMLSLLYRTFTEIWQEKEAAMQNNQLMRLLLANSAHEFRTPLNATINYLEIVLDGSLNQETRENLSRSHSASKSLIYIINDLLDLTNAENGRSLIENEVFDLTKTLSEATDIFWEEAMQKHVDLQVVQHSSLPPVLGDQRRVRQVITNLISNAIQHTSTGAVTIESCVLSDCGEPGHIAIEVAIHDTGSGMSRDTVEALFCELEQVSNKGYIQSPNIVGNSSADLSSESKSVLGLGLALVARIVRNMDGQLSVKSEYGKGSCFKVRLKFQVSSVEEIPAAPNASSSAGTLSRSKSEHTAKPGTDEPFSRDNIQTIDKPNQESDGVPCFCGESNEQASRLHDKDKPFLNVDISLESGVSTQKSVPTSETTKLPTPEPNETTPETWLKLSSSPEQDSPSELNLKETQPPVKEVPAGQAKPATSAKTTTDAPKPATSPEPNTAQCKLHVLVAEDDPINSIIVRKRLEKFGHSVRMTGNGKECASVYRESPDSFDAVLMDLQMPIVDGVGSTRMIRQNEEQMQANTDHARTPVFAVSASLVEKDWQSYVDSGFDGWIMKPIDFQRANVLLGGVRCDAARDSCIYQAGLWEQGGWFHRSPSWTADKVVDEPLNG